MGVALLFEVPHLLAQTDTQHTQPPALGTAVGGALLNQEVVQSRATILLRDGSMADGVLSSITHKSVLLAAELPPQTSTNPSHEQALREVVAIWLPRSTNERGAGFVRRPDGTIGPSIDDAKSLLSHEAARLRGDDEVVDTKQARRLDQRQRGAPREEPVVTTQRQGMLVLRNGEQFVGSLSIAPNEARWNHPTFGTMPVEIDDVAELILRPTTAGEAQSRALDTAVVGDVVELINGDVVEGFVESISNELLMTVEDAATDATADATTGATTPMVTSVKIPITRVARIRFAKMANTQAPSQSFNLGTDTPVSRLWMRDGSVLIAHNLELQTNGVVRFQSPTMLRAPGMDVLDEKTRLFTETTTTTRESTQDVVPPTTSDAVHETGICEVSIRDVNAIALQPDAFEVVGTNHMAQVDVIGAFRVLDSTTHARAQRSPPQNNDLGVSPQRLEGPSDFVITPPDQRSDWVFVAEFSLDDTSIAGASAVVRTRAKSTPVGATGNSSETVFTLDASHAVQRVRIPLRATDVLIEVREGEHGLVGNVVRLERAMFVRVSLPDA